LDAPMSAPFAIVIGGDANGNSIFNDRPTFAIDVNQGRHRGDTIRCF
jgi:hypothetical protein